MNGCEVVGKHRVVVILSVFPCLMMFQMRPDRQQLLRSITTTLWFLGVL
jgi:hypothetical protein